MTLETLRYRIFNKGEHVAMGYVEEGRTRTDTLDNVKNKELGRWPHGDVIVYTESDGRYHLQLARDIEWEALPPDSERTQGLFAKAAAADRRMANWENEDSAAVSRLNAKLARAENT